jgi:hypothetical protein
MLHPPCLVPRLTDREADFYSFHSFRHQKKELVGGATGSFLVLSCECFLRKEILSSPDSLLIQNSSCGGYTSAWSKVFVAEF